MREALYSRSPIKIWPVAIPKILYTLKCYERVLSYPEVIQREKEDEYNWQKKRPDTLTEQSCPPISSVLRSRFVTAVSLTRLRR